MHFFAFLQQGKSLTQKTSSEMHRRWNNDRATHTQHDLPYFRFHSDYIKIIFFFYLFLNFYMVDGQFRRFAIETKRREEKKKLEI
jgi:hypothetical protein